MGRDRPYWPNPFDPAPWMRRAACHGKPTEMFFPPRGGDTSTPKAICAECPVRKECLAYGMNERQGIFGGLTERERRALRSQRRREREAS